MAPCGKKTTSGRMLGMWYILSMTKHAWGCKRGGDSPPFALGETGGGGGVTGGAVAPLIRGPAQRTGKKNLVLIFWCADPPMVLCMGLHMVLGHDGFRPLVFCRFGQGNYGYVLIQG